MSNAVVARFGGIDSGPQMIDPALPKKRTLWNLNNTVPYILHYTMESPTMYQAVTTTTTTLQYVV